MNLVAVILTQNEAHNIVDAIASLRDWVDAVVVWDGGSTDETRCMAMDAGALVVMRPFDNFAAQRQAVLDTINAKWILFIDADERATPAFATEVQHCVNLSSTPDQDNLPVGYWLARRNYIAGVETRGGGYYPDYQLRLLWRQGARYDSTREVHEIVILAGNEGHLQAPIIHYNYQNWAHFHQKQPFYARYEARILAARGIRPRPHNFALQPLREFQRRFIKLQGWRDGLHGLRLALLLAWYYGFMPYWLLLQEA